MSPSRLCERAEEQKRKNVHGVRIIHTNSTGAASPLPSRKNLHDLYEWYRTENRILDAWVLFLNFWNFHCDVGLDWLMSFLAFGHFIFYTHTGSYKNAWLTYLISLMIQRINQTTNKLQVLCLSTAMTKAATERNHELQFDPIFVKANRHIRLKLLINELLWIILYCIFTFFLLKAF